MPHMDSIRLKTKELLTYDCGCHGNVVTIATRYVADAYCPKEPPCQIWTQYNGVTKQNVFDSDSLTQTCRLRLIDSLDSQKRSTRFH